MKKLRGGGLYFSNIKKNPGNFYIQEIQTLSPPPSKVFPYQIVLYPLGGQFTKIKQFLQYAMFVKNSQSYFLHITKIVLKNWKNNFSIRISVFYSLKHRKKYGVETNKTNRLFCQFFSKGFWQTFNCCKTFSKRKLWFFQHFLVKIVLNLSESRLTKIQRFLPCAILVKIPKVKKMVIFSGKN